MNAAEVLDGIDARHGHALSAWRSKDDPSTWIGHLKASADDVPALVSALRSVLDLHTEIVVANGRHVCSLCPTLRTFGQLDATNYPCPTVRVITEALGGTP